jgi:hypothetical protein
MPCRLPLKTLYRGLALSPETEALLEQAMTRLDEDDPDRALQAVLRAFLSNGASSSG